MGTELTDEERAELEALREAKRAQEAAAERAELEALRASKAAGQDSPIARKAKKGVEGASKTVAEALDPARHAQEDAEYYAERARLKEERRRERENPDYGVDDLPPISGTQKIVIGVLAVMFVAFIGYLIWFNVLGGDTKTSEKIQGSATVAESVADTDSQDGGDAGSVEGADSDLRDGIAGDDQVDAATGSQGDAASDSQAGGDAAPKTE